jgi:arylsulfatase A-like enzyme
MNIVFIIIDTLRYDFISANNNPDVKTPNFDRLAAKSWNFDNVFCGSYPTIPHRTDVMTGEYGAPFHSWRPLSFEWHTLPRALADAGYCTQLIHDTPHLTNGGHAFDFPFHSWKIVHGAEVDRPLIDDAKDLPENWKFDSLFDSVNKEHDFIPLYKNTYLSANRNRKKPEDWNTAKLFIEASDFLSRNKNRDNFFLWIDSFDPHEPWDAPPEFMKMYDKTPGYDGTIDPRAFSLKETEKLDEKIINRVKAAFAAKVSHLDKWFGLFLDRLEETGLSKNTAVVLTADHGTQLDEFGRFCKNFLYIREPVAHVPLLISVPDGGKGRCGAFVQPQDIFPTILSIAGAKPPENLPGFDAYSAAQNGETGTREFALSGFSPNAIKPSEFATWPINMETSICTLFTKDCYFEFNPQPEKCKIWHYGSQEEKTGENQSKVDELYPVVMKELELRGTHPALMEWLRSQGKSEFPKDIKYAHGWPPPPGFACYYKRLYTGE